MVRCAVPCLAVLLAIALPAAAQERTLSLAEVAARYHQMSEIHILKCDKDDDRRFDRGELACVRSIYSVMYAGRNR